MSQNNTDYGPSSQEVEDTKLVITLWYKTKATNLQDACTEYPDPEKLIDLYVHLYEYKLENTDTVTA
jgi:hypothetical protein